MKKLLISAQIFLVSILGNVWRVGLLMCVCVSKGYNISLQNISRIISLEKSSD